MRAFVDWQIDLLNEHTDLNSGVVVVRPVGGVFRRPKHSGWPLSTIIRGLNEKGEAVSDARRSALLTVKSAPTRIRGIPDSGSQPGHALRVLQHHRSGHQLPCG
ncbi:hypothetical protein ACNKHQ_09155 [Shigella flexneri]